MTADRFALVVTGATGFLGRRTLAMAADEMLGALPVGWVRSATDAPGPPGAACVVQGDLGSPTDIARAVRSLPDGPLRLIHLGGYFPHGEETEDAAERAIAVNVLGSAALVKALGDRLQAVVFASTSDVYGYPARLPVSEDAALSLRTFYAASKAAAELMLHVELGRAGIPLACLRLAHVYGPGDTSSKAIPLFARRCLQGMPPEVAVGSHGASVRDYLFADDAVRALCGAAARCASGCFNVGGGTPVSLYDLACLVCDLTGTCHPTERRVPDEAVTRIYLDVERARRGLDFVPRTGLRQGIMAYINWLKSR